MSLHNESPTRTFGFPTRPRGAAAVYFAINFLQYRNRVKKSANRPFSPATRSICLLSAVAVQARVELFEFRLSGELFHFE